MYQMPWMPSRDWPRAPVTPSYKVTSEDRLLLLVTRETRHRHGLVYNNATAEKDLVKSLCEFHSHQVRNISFILSVHIFGKDKDKCPSRP